VSTPTPPDAENPFVTRRVRPGAIPYFFPPHVDAAALVDQWRAAGRRGAIVGPHGSGKSTLLAALRGALAQSGHTTHLVELHDDQHRLPREPLATAAAGDVLLIDGFEQLGLLSRWRLGLLCRRRRLGLLITAHRETGIPTLLRTSIDASLARRVVDHLLGPEPERITDSDLAQSLRRHRGDLREVLFEMYDLYESRKP
jgi:energy-coupling factor transporter ATP-binding protein EcfA2